MEQTITADLISEFEEYLFDNEKSRPTIEKYLRDVRMFANYCRKSTDICKKDVIRFKEYLESNYAIASANSIISSINSFFRFANWNELIAKHFKVQRKIYCSEKRELTKPDYEKLIKVALKNNNERLSLIIQTLGCTGIRISELKYITVDAARTGEVTIRCKGKTRTVFLISKLRSKLLNYAKKNGIQNGVIFITRGGKPIDRSNVWREMKNLCGVCGIDKEKVFPHNLRHLFARSFYKIEKDIAKLADVLGHSSINTTRIYIISTGTEHRRQMENLKLVI